MGNNKKIVVGVTGASGSIYAKRLINILAKDKNIDLNLVFSEQGKAVFEYEMKTLIKADKNIKIFNNKDFFVSFASGSSVPYAMIIAPCSTGTLGRIANGTSDDLICRTADVVLKERKKLILLLREAPYNLVHIKNMEKITLAGGIVCPASPSFYSSPKNIEELCDTIVFRILDLIGVENKSFRW